MASSQQLSASNVDEGAINPTTDYIPTFYIGYHESTSTRPATDIILRQAQNAGYDMVTSPITTQHFQRKVLAVVKAYILEQLSNANTDKPSKSSPIPIISPLTPLDTSLSPEDAAASQLIAYSSSWIDLGSADPLIANISRQVLNIEIAYASFCGIGQVVIPGPKSSRCGPTFEDRLTQYARAIQEALNICNYTQISIQMPMYTTGKGCIKPDHLATYANNHDDIIKAYEGEENKLFESWDIWNLIRTVCKYNSRLCVELEIPGQLPTSSLQSRWYAEPLRILSFTPSTFLINKAGHPALSKAHQSLITRYMRLKVAPWLLLCDVGLTPEQNDITNTNNLTSSPSVPLSNDIDVSDLKSFPTIETAKSLGKGNSDKTSDYQESISYLIYLRHLQKNQPARTVFEAFGSGYQDYLQAPLQPLADNLESITYEVFEKDPVKYDWYERAITCALSDWSLQSKPTSCENNTVVIAVVGSGRGPLVTRALRASKTTGVPVEIWAVEKNPNAYVLLQRNNKKEWDGVVNVVKSDMRAWKGPIRKEFRTFNQRISIDASTSSDTIYGHVDILVSELLGSFADNELSPECLDGVQHVLAPEYGISIPSSYTAHLTPISAPRLHAEISQRALTDPNATNTPYVVMLHAIDFLASSVPYHPRIQEAWEFIHPLPASTLAISSARRSGGVSGGGGGSMCGGDGANEHNVRAAHLKFVCKDRGVMHGIAGYFESVLYENGAKSKVELSTRPDTIDLKSKDMISWFPIYFPLKNPLYFPNDSELEVSIWRQTDDRKVWYEWLVEAFVMIGPESRLRLGISDMGSSREVGCLM